MALYETLAQHFIDDIQAQRLPAGSRLPALRTMAKQHQVSMTTATKAYDYLQQTG
ncbi:GntR family transcriptional regulator [Marinomonas sp.]